MSEEKTIWGIHMGWQHELKPIEQKYIAIGWADVGNLSKLPQDRDAFKKVIKSTYTDIKEGAIPVVAGTLFRFATEMKKGDLVVYPSKPDRMVNLGFVQGSYVWDPAADAHFPNRRAVSWIRSIPRAEFSPDALHEIGSAITLFQIKNHTEEFLAAFEGELTASNDVDEKVVSEATEFTEETTRDFVIKILKSKLDPFQFEHFVAHLLERLGYYSRVTAKSGDSGVDIIAHKDVLGFEPPIIKVQCKQILANIGQPDVAQLYGHVQQGEFGLFVTLGGYTAQAKQFENSKHNLRLIGGTELTELIFQHYEGFDPNYRTILPLQKSYLPALKISDGA